MRNEPKGVTAAVKKRLKTEMKTPHEVSLPRGVFRCEGLSAAPIGYGNADAAPFVHLGSGRNI